MPTPKTILSIVELGGYPDFSNLYQTKGFKIERADSMRKAVKILKTLQPDVIVAEFNFQSDFRDRTSSLETLMASVQRMTGTQVIVFYEPDQHPQLQRLLSVFKVFATIPFPIDQNTLATTLDLVLEST